MPSRTEPIPDGSPARGPVHVVLGVTGSIAAYKACEIVRGLVKQGAVVTVVMSRGGARFVTPLTFETLTGRPVVTELLPPPGEGAQWLDVRDLEKARQDVAASSRQDPHGSAQEGPTKDRPQAGPSAKAWPSAQPKAAMPHIALGDTADLFLIAPATANIIAKIAHGIADDALTTLACSSRAPIVVAPAMDDEMIRREVVHQNLSLIVRRGGFVIPPGEGELASGHVGPGRLADPQRIVRVALEMAARGRELAGKRVLVTAGATEEPWDPARHLSSPSSGRMGYALAEEARRRGAQVVLVTGTPKAPLPGGVEVVRVRTAEEMRRAVLDALPSANVLLMAAAVSDYRPERTEPEKIKKSGEPVTLTLVPNPDILEEAGRAKGARVHVGFSVATGDAVAEARDKLGKKNLDLVVSNDPNEKGAAFGGSTNRVTLVPAKGEPIELPLMSKDEVARAVLDEVGRLLVRGTGS